RPLAYRSLNREKSLGAFAPAWQSDFRYPSCPAYLTNPRRGLIVTKNRSSFFTFQGMKFRSVAAAALSASRFQPGTSRRSGSGAPPAPAMGRVTHAVAGAHKMLAAFPTSRRHTRTLYGDRAGTRCSIRGRP